MIADATGVMATPAEIAARDGVSKQAITKTVRRLADEHALPVERDGRDRIVKFSVAHYDHLRGAYANSAKVNASRESEPASPAARPGAPSQPPPSGTSRDEALRQQAWLQVGRERLRRQEEAGKLVRRDRVDAALAECGQEIRAVVGRLPNKADDLALIVSREGVHGLRSMLRTIAFELGTEIADKLSVIGSAAPETDPALEGEEL